MVADCLFCRIAAGEVPSNRVASTPLSYAFSDIEPAMPSHVLVVPRQHIPDVGAIRAEHAEVLADMFATAQEVARIEGIGERGYRLVINKGDDACASVDHLHLHVLGGRQMGWPPG